MARGRKKQENSLNQVTSIRITEKQKEILEKNTWLKKELDKLVRDHLDDFVMH